MRDFERCKRLRRYLNLTRGLGVFFPRGRGEDLDGFSLVACSDSDWAGDRESRKSTSSGMIWWGPYLISDLVKGQSVVATSKWRGRAVCGSLSHEGHDPDQASIELHWDECQDGATARQQCGSCNAGTTGCWASTPCRSGCAVGAAVGQGQRCAVRAEPTRTNCANLGTKVHSVARFTKLFDMIRLVDRDDSEAEASKETLPVPLPVAGVAHSSSPLASLITFLSTLVVHGRQGFSMKPRHGFASSSKGQVYLDMGRVFRYQHSARFPGLSTVVWLGGRIRV